MNTFALDKKYQKFDFDEISVEDLQVISGGTGGTLRQILIGVVVEGAIWAGQQVYQSFTSGAIAEGANAYANQASENYKYGVIM